MLHPISFLPPAEKYFKKIKEKGLKDAFFEAINQIRLDPYSGSPKKATWLEFMVAMFFIKEQL